METVEWLREQIDVCDKLFSDLSVKLTQDDVKLVYAIRSGWIKDIQAQEVQRAA